MQKFSLLSLSQRSLDMIASLVYGQAMNVVITERLTTQAAVAAKGRTVFMNPKECGLYDLFLLANLLRYRATIAKRYRKSAVPRRLIRQWIAQQQQRLDDIYPGARRFPGNFHPQKATASLPEIVWTDVSFSALATNDFATAGHGEVCSTEVEDVEILGTDDDLAILLKSIESGTLALEEWRELPEMPIATIPAKLVVRNVLPKFWEKLCEEHGCCNSFVKESAQCILDKFEGIQELNVYARHQSSGSDIDANRLYQVGISMHNGHPPAIFQKDRRNVNTSYDARQYLGILCMDINTWSHERKQRTTVSRSYEFNMARIFQELEMDFIIISFRDFIVRLEDGRDVYIHAPFILKDIDEAMDDVIWSRLDLAWRRGRPHIGRAASFQPLHFRTIGKYIKKATEQKQYRFFNFFYFSGCTLTEDYETPEIQARTMHSLDAIFDKWVEQAGGCWYWYTSLPGELTTHTKEGSYLAQYSNFLYY